MDIFLYAYSGFCHKSDKSNERKDVFDFVGICGYLCVCVCVHLFSKTFEAKVQTLFADFFFSFS